MDNSEIYEINYDDIISLPTDDTQPTPVELEIMNNLFKENKSLFSKLFDELKEPLIVAILFILFNLGYTTNVIHSLLPITNSSDIFLVIAKAFFIMLAFWIVKHFKLARLN